MSSSNDWIDSKLAFCSKSEKHSEQIGAEKVASGQIHCKAEQEMNGKKQPYANPD